MKCIFSWRGWIIKFWWAPQENCANWIYMLEVMRVVFTYWMDRSQNYKLVRAMCWFTILLFWTWSFKSASFSLQFLLMCFKSPVFRLFWPFGFAGCSGVLIKCKFLGRINLWVIHFSMLTCMTGDLTKSFISAVMKFLN